MARSITAPTALSVLAVAVSLQVMPYPSVSAYVASSILARRNHNHHHLASLACGGAQLNSLHRATTETSANYKNVAPSDAISPTALANGVDDEATTTDGAASTFQIRRAQYPELAQAADLLTEGFYPQLHNNPLLRPMRRLLELDRLQNNFPYEDLDRHFYLVAYDCGSSDGGDAGAGRTTPTEDSNSSGTGKIIGFCDIDGRVPKSKGVNVRVSLFVAKKVNRPQPYLSDLVVDPEHRRRGVASALMAEAERRATTMGFEELYLGVRTTNVLALQMYSRMGYEGLEPYGDMLAFLEVQKDLQMLRRSFDQCLYRV